MSPFKWSRIRRIYIPKDIRHNRENPLYAPRPLGIPSFSDKIVQNNIMMILSSIYESEFEYVNANYGLCLPAQRHKKAVILQWDIRSRMGHNQIMSPKHTEVRV
jgi:hypothetical protein